MPPPEGMAHVCVVSVFGSKRTTVFGWTSDSLNQIAPSRVTAMAYGAAFGPPGDGNSFTLPFRGSSRPRNPRALSPYQMTSSAPTAIRGGRAPSGNAYSVSFIVLGSTAPILLAPAITKNGMTLVLTGISSCIHIVVSDLG